jgi:hypothetical protein
MYRCDYDSSHNLSNFGTRPCCVNARVTAAAYLRSIKGSERPKSHTQDMEESLEQYDSRSEHEIILRHAEARVCMRSDDCAIFIVNHGFEVDAPVD